MTGAIEITVNGEARTAPAGASVADLLASLALPAGKVAVERNREIVPRSRYQETAPSADDQIEIVHFVGGG